MADIRNRSMTLADCRFDWVYHGYDAAFEGQATFSDIDGVVYLNDHFLFTELKMMRRDEDLPKLPNGQLKVYKALASRPKTQCYFVAGDMQKSVPFYIYNVNTGEHHDLRMMEDLDARAFLRSLIKQWNEFTKIPKE